MKLLKPEWINHNGKGIFAVDIHPDGSRFATGGQGEDGGLIVLWNLAPVTSEKIEEDDRVPKMLSQMNDHTGCVNCLRWSISGEYLASGGDDNIVIIWQLSRNGGSSTVFGTGGTIVNIENWKCTHVLRGHIGDVLDLAWSPDDSFMATGSVDNTIIVWNALKFPEILHTITNHHGLVKGIVFDPVGKYMASQSDDKSVCIWNTNDWSLEKKITEPFQESSGTTHALRLNWSPDGQYIVTAHAMNNGGPVAKIIERNGWKTKMDFVGHRKAITCVRFSERILYEKEPNKNQYVCCAIGSRDRTFSVWLTALKRPLVVVHELFENSIMDISWSRCGYLLLACSLDGTVAYMEFTTEEIGKPMSFEEKFIFHKKTFGTSIKATKSLILSSIIENVDFQKNQLKQQEERVKKAQMFQQSPTIKSNTFPFKAPDGKLTGGLMSSSCQDSTQVTEVLQKQKEVKTKDGKRRIVPMLLESDSSNDAHPVQLSTVSDSLTVSTEEVKKNNSKPQISDEKSQSASLNVPPINNSTSTIHIGSVKRKLDSSENVKKKAKKKKEKELNVNTPDEDNHALNVHHDKVLSTEVISNVNTSLISLSYPDPEDELTFQLKMGSSFASKEACLEVKNDLAGSFESSVHYLRCSSKLNVLWETCLLSPITTVSGNNQMICASCHNQSLHIFSTNGRRLFPEIVLDSKISILESYLNFCMVITSHGYVSIWDVKAKSSIISKKSIQPIIQGSRSTLSESRITDKGYPVLTLSNHQVYVYDISISSWTHLTSACDMFQTTADITSNLESSLPKGLLQTIQAPLNRLSRQMIKGLRRNQSKQQISTLSYLECQMCSAVSLSSPEEYHYWLMTYVRYLVQADEKGRLRDLCEDLLGPAGISSKKWQPRVLCYEKRDLLKDILPIVASNLNFQRFYSEFQQQLESINQR